STKPVTGIISPIPPLQIPPCLNSSHPTIKFTIDYSSEEIPFLDTLVYIEHNTVKTKLYKKPIDKKQYLHYNSEHPNHMKNSIPYAQALRYKRIISEDTILDKELITLADNFISRGYPQTIVDQQIGKTHPLKRSELIQYKEKSSAEIDFTPFVLTFSNIFNNKGKYNLYEIIRNVWKELTEMVPILKNIKPPKIILKKCNSIGRCVESSKFPPKWWPSQDGLSNNGIICPTPRSIPDMNISSKVKASYICKPCEGNKCQTCEIITHGSTFKSTTYNEIFNIKTNNCNCSTNDIVYLITCKLCNLQYVGES